MRILKQNLKSGKIKIKAENPDDLWHLERILEPGDIVTSRTMRKTTIKRGHEIEHGDRKPLILAIELESTDFHKATHSLRLKGHIRSGPEDLVKLKSYHSLQIEPGSILTIQKEEWKSYQLERLKKARIKQPLLFFCVLDREQADFARLTDSGLEMAGTITYKKTWGEEKRDEYYREIHKTLEAAMNKYHGIVIAGPGFEKENLLEFLDKANPELAAGIILEYASSTGRSGVQEIIKHSGNRILKETRISKETGIVEKLLEEIAKDGLAVYGPKETEQAIKSGAVETLLVSEDKIKDFEPLMATAEKMKSRIFIISSEHESGEKFLNLGGIAGLLRFRMN